MGKKRVAIVGAGISGLLSAKYALENDLEPVVFEKTSKIGGLWTADNTAIWEGMRTNVSKYVSTISDHHWPPDTNIYPKTAQVLEYFESYARKFNLEAFIKFKHKVEYARRLEDDHHSWEIRYRNLETNELATEQFDFMIIASGIYSQPKIPNDENMSSFKGLVKHSCQFRLNDPDLENKSVVVVGGCISACDLCGHIADQSKQVFNVFRRTPLVVPQLWMIKVAEPNFYSIQPAEFLSNSREEVYSSLSVEENKKKKRKLIQELFPYQKKGNASCPEDLQVDFDDLDTEIITGQSDFYIDRVKSGKIRPIRSTIERFDEHGVHLSNGEYVQADVVIYCTGFKLSIDYLEPGLIEAMKLRQDKPKFSMLLYKSTFVPGWETMAFIGPYARLYFTGYELQARWAMSVFVGKVKLPDRQILDEFVRKLEEKRNLDKGAQYPYGPFAVAVDAIAQELGLMPNFEEIKQRDPQLYDYLWNDEVLWSHYLFDKQDQEYFLDMLKEVRAYKEKVYEINETPHEMKYSDIQKKFMKHFNL